MTTVVPDQRPDPDRPKAAWKRGRRPLGNHVAQIVGRLQARLLGDSPHPEALGALARLRRGIGREPGFDYTLDRYLHVPEQLSGTRPGDDSDATDATDAEHAAHDAVTLYALHQQSRRQRMHLDGRGLGYALAELMTTSNGPDGVRRRFAALGTATGYQETIYHLRSLTTMLREHQVGLDYGLLADDLQTLRRPDGRARVQAIWGREFFRSRAADASDTDTSDTDTDISEETPS